MYRRIRQSFVLCCLGVLADAAPAADKSGDSLFHPTPPGRLREMSTDRPDQTESPYTVDAGHWQVELDVATFTGDDAEAERTRAWSFLPVNLKVGLTPRLDLQLLAEPHLRERVTDAATGTVTRARGFGDVITRLKFNCWGNEVGPTAFGVMPFVKWPLHASAVRNGETEGGLIVPVAVDLGGGWGLGAMTELDWVAADGGGHAREWVNSATLSRDLTPRWAGYVELVATTGDAPGFRWEGQFDCGLTYALAEATQLDFGCNFGITESAADYQPFVGYSQRF